MDQRSDFSHKVIVFILLALLVIAIVGAIAKADEEQPNEVSEELYLDTFIAQVKAEQRLAELRTYGFCAK